MPHVPQTLHSLVPYVPHALRALVLHIPLALCALVPHLCRSLGALVPHVSHLRQLSHVQHTLMHLMSRSSRVLSLL